jgi:hypothetical protein
MDVRQRAQRNGPGGCIISPFLSVSERSGRKTPSDLCCVNTVLGFGAIFGLQKARELLRTERNCTPTRTLSLQAHTSATISCAKTLCASLFIMPKLSGFFPEQFILETITDLQKHTKLINEEGKHSGLSSKSAFPSYAKNPSMDQHMYNLKPRTHLKFHKVQNTVSALLVFPIRQPSGSLKGSKFQMFQQQ